MKLLHLFILPNIIVAAEPATLKLDYKEDKESDYPAQIQAAFTKLLASNAALAKEFSKFEAPPLNEARGRYSGTPKIQSLVISESEHVNFATAGGKKEFEKTITLYYRFDEGEHRGRSTSSGFFATFAVTGTLTYRRLANDEFDLTNAAVGARFMGFSRKLESPDPNQ